MSLIYVTKGDGNEILYEMNTPFPASAVTNMLGSGEWKGCAFWTITKKPNGQLHAWVTWEGEDRPVPIENLPKMIQMKLLTGAY